MNVASFLMSAFFRLLKPPLILDISQLVPFLNAFVYNVAYDLEGIKGEKEISSGKKRVFLTDWLWLKMFHIS